MASPARESRVRQKISNGRADPWRTLRRHDTRLAGWFWNVASDNRRSFVTRLLCSLAKSARKLRPGREFYSRERERLWRRRSARHPRRGRCRDRKISDRPCAAWRDRMELRRVYDGGGCHADHTLS